MNTEKSTNDINSFVSVITVCFNSAETIEDAILSVEAQKYSYVEHLIIDGASTDNTMAIVGRHESIRRAFSEPDSGIYDAMNKGIAKAKGEIIGMLNADDLYADDDVLSKVVELFSDASIDACFADLVYVKQQDTNEVVRYWKSREFQPGLFKEGWMPAHPTFFARKKVYEQFGGFDLNFTIAADFELLFRFIERNRIKTRYLPKVLIKMRLGGTSNKSLANIYKQNGEIINVLKHYYSDFSISNFVLSKAINRLAQFLRKPGK